MNPAALSLSFWRRLWRGWLSAWAPPRGRAAAHWVPIRRLTLRHRPRVLTHLQALDERDRYLRFGYAATDAQIATYVQGLDFERDAILGIFNRRLQLVAMTHLAYSVDPQMASCAEFGVSVLAHQRGRGLGARLFARAVNQARNQGVRLLFVHALSENAPMLHIARSVGARVERDGAESEAYLVLPDATLDSQVTGLVQAHMAELDYQLKLQARQFRHWLGLVQEVRQGLWRARSPAPPPRR